MAFPPHSLSEYSTVPTATMAAANSASDPVDQYLQRCSGTPVIQAAMLGAKGVGKENIIARVRLSKESRTLPYQS